MALASRIGEFMVYQVHFCCMAPHLIVGGGAGETIFHQPFGGLTKKTFLIGGSSKILGGSRWGVWKNHNIFAVIHSFSYRFVKNFPPHKLILAKIRYKGVSHCGLKFFSWGFFIYISEKASVLSFCGWGVFLVEFLAGEKRTLVTCWRTKKNYKEALKRKKKKTLQLFLKKPILL